MPTQRARPALLEADVDLRSLIPQEKSAAERIKTSPPAGDAVAINSIEIGEVVGHA